MLPLVVPEPAGGPPAIPPTVPTPNEHAGVGAGLNTFAAMVDAGTDGPGDGTGAAKSAGKHVRVGADSWLLAKLSALNTADGSTAASMIGPQQGPKIAVDASIDDDTNESDEGESTTVSVATTTADVAMLYGPAPVVPPVAIRIPVPGDEDADDDRLQVANDEPLSKRFTASGRTVPTAAAGLNVSEATHQDQVPAFTAPEATDHANPTAATAETFKTERSVAEASPAGRVENLPTSTTSTDTASTSAPTESPRVADPATIGGAGISASTIPAATQAPQQARAAQALAGAKQVASDVRDDGGQVSDANAPASSQTESHPANQGGAPRPWGSDVRPFRPAVPAKVPRGTTVRSAVAAAATGTEKPADAVKAVLDGGPAPATPAQDAPGVTRDAASIRSTPSNVSARRVDAATPGLPFSTNQDAGSESGARDDEARGRQASAMSARLAAAVASTSEQPVTARAATPAPVFAIPAVATPTTPAVTATVEAHGATPALPAENVDRLVQTMHVNVRSGVMEATVTLRPEHFGDVTIQLRVDGTNVTALIQTESSGVRQWLESQEQAIRNGLAAHGLELDRLVVNPDGEQQQARDDSEANNSRRRAYRRRQQATERFEITV